MQHELPVSIPDRWTVEPVFYRQSKDEVKKGTPKELKFYALMFAGNIEKKSTSEREVESMRDMAKFLNRRKLEPRPRIQCRADTNIPPLPRKEKWACLNPTESSLRTQRMWRLGGSATPPKPETQPLPDPMKTTPLAQSPPSTCSESSLSEAVKALNLTLKKHAEERTKELEIQLLKLEVTDLELQMLTLARKLRAAKEKLIAQYAAEPEMEPVKIDGENVPARLDALQARLQTPWSDVAAKLEMSDSMIYQVKSGKRKMSKKALARLGMLEKQSPQNA